LHLGIRLGLCTNKANPLILAELGLFILLDKIARGAAACTEAVSASYYRNLVKLFELQVKRCGCKLTIALEAILLPDLTTLVHLENPLATNATQSVPTTAVAIEKGPAVKLRILIDAVGDTTVGDAWDDYCNQFRTCSWRYLGLGRTPCQKAGLEWRAAVSSRVVPLLLHRHSGLHCADGLGM